MKLLSLVSMWKQERETALFVATELVIYYFVMLSLLVALIMKWAFMHP